MLSDSGANEGLLTFLDVDVDRVSSEGCGTFRAPKQQQGLLDVDSDEAGGRDLDDRDGGHDDGHGCAG